MNNYDFGDSFGRVVSDMIAYLPNVIGALLILIVGYLLAKLLASLTRKGLKMLRFDEALEKSVAGDTITRVFTMPSGFVGKVVFWLVFIGAISAAVAALNVPILNDMLAAIYAYIPHIIAAILIFLVASTVSAGAATFVKRVMGDTALSNIIATVIPVVILVVAAFMIMNELQIATDIVNILFTAMVGAVALGLALAFGLGGRDVARNLLEQAYESGRRNAGEVKSEVNRAAQNAKHDARRARNKR